MNLNDTKRFKELDTEDMIGHINDLPEQLLKAWDLGQKLALPDWEGIERVIHDLTKKATVDLNRRSATVWLLLCRLWFP